MDLSHGGGAPLREPGRTPIEAALADWRAAIGDGNVETERLAPYETATFATTQRVLGVLRPGTRAEVQACLRVATAHGVPTYPVSGGKNWGLGSRVPVRDGSVVLDLGRLNAIRDFDTVTGVLTVEPGATFRQVSAFLRETAWFCPVIGGPGDATVLGNAVDRGDVVGPFRDRASQVGMIEVVLPTGELLRTGHARWDAARAGGRSRWGVGPALDGLFAQSNLGVVTAMTIWLAPRPAFMQVVSMAMSTDAALGQAFAAVQGLALRGVLGSAGFTFWNRYKLVARRAHYPFGETGGRTPLPPEALPMVPWYGCGALFAASRELGLAARPLLEAALRPIDAGLEIVDSDELPDLLTDSFFTGTPTDANVASTYWRKEPPLPPKLDPDAHGCGVIWLCPTLPYDSPFLVAFLPILEARILAHGFEPNLGMHTDDGRCLYGYVALMYDRDAAGEDARALACHDDVLQLLIENGCHPFRLGLAAMGQLPPPDDAYGAVLGGIKRLLDPADVLAPGRYDFRET